MAAVQHRRHEGQRDAVLLEIDGDLAALLADRDGELAAGQEITPREVEGAAAAQGVAIGSGDAVLIRTGFMQVWKRDEAEFDRAQPGVNHATALWAGDREVALLGADNSAVEIFPTAAHLPVHQEFIRDQGGYLLELLNLDELSQDQVYEFMLVVAPLRIDRTSMTGRVALEGKAVHVHDVLADPEYRASDYQQAFGYRTNLGVPLLRDGKTVGVFALVRGKVNPFTEKQIDLLIKPSLPSRMHGCWANCGRGPVSSPAQSRNCARLAKPHKP